jgi:hypothetical protein
LALLSLADSAWNTAMNSPPMILRFFSGSTTPGQLAHELLAGIDVNDLDAQVLAKGFHHLLGLVQAQQAGIDEDTGELVADGSMNQGRRHRGIDTAGQAQDDFIAPDVERILPIASSM